MKRVYISVIDKYLDGTLKEGDIFKIIKSLLDNDDTNILLIHHDQDKDIKNLGDEKEYVDKIEFIKKADVLVLGYRWETSWLCQKELGYAKQYDVPVIAAIDYCNGVYVDYTVMKDGLATHLRTKVGVER